MCFHLLVAPEQTGSVEALTEDHRTDLYSLGIVFWTLLVGRGTMPFEGGPVELLHAIVHKRPMPVHEVRRDVPQVLALIIEKVWKSCIHQVEECLTITKNSAISQKSRPAISVCLWPQRRSTTMSTTAAFRSHSGDKRSSRGEVPFLYYISEVAVFPP